MVTDKQLANLVPLDQRSQEERKEIASLGGAASAQEKKKQALFREAVRAIAGGQVLDDSTRQELEQLGLQSADINGAAEMALKLKKRVVKTGDPQAFKALFAASGESTALDITSDGEQIQGLIIGFKDFSGGQTEDGGE